MPVLPSIPYIGGKCRVAAQIGGVLRSTGAELLVDVFGGSGSVTMRAGFEKRVYNDAAGDLVNLFRVLADRRRRVEFLRLAQWLPTSRRLFDGWRREYVRGGLSLETIADPVERAVAMLYLCMHSFGGKVRSGGFPVSTGERIHVKEVCRWRSFLRQLVAFSEFWRDTVIECLPFDDLISLYGWRDGAVLYCDPPYFGTEDYYSRRFSRADHVFLAHLLLEVPAAAAVSYYDCPEVRDLYPVKSWDYVEFRATRNTANRFSGHQKPVETELLLVKRSEVPRA